jgi:DNA-binding transcriptional MocR family regulator
MSGTDGKSAQTELDQIDGALDVLFTLREEFAQWLEEAQSEERKEELENVHRHVDAMEQEYKRRREAAVTRLASS